MTPKKELAKLEGENIVFNIFGNQVETGILSFDDNENAVVTFDDVGTMAVDADKVLDTFDNWSKENYG